MSDRMIESQAIVVPAASDAPRLWAIRKPERASVGNLQSAETDYHQSTLTPWRETLAATTKAR